MSAPTPKEIRECYQDYRSAWQDIRDEGAADMQAISPEGPWTPEDRAMREDAGRPCVHLDQINQYLNQTTGNVRKNKRAVKVMPKGDGANDQDAKMRSSLIMGVEERSKAQPIYLHAFQCMIERSYGFAVIRTDYKDFDSFDLEIVVKPVLNPDIVLLSPNYKQPDASDLPDGFILERISRREFKSKYRDAKITDFTDEQMDAPGARDWVTNKTVQLGEYWKIEYDREKLLLVEAEPGSESLIILTEKQWKRKKKRLGEVKRERVVEKPRVMQYMTNGLEILDDVEWKGTRIPIISCLGPERWQTEGGNARRSLLSMVRFARDPQMLFDFLATQECEEAGMVPKVPFVGAKGQFESDKEVWEEINKVPHSFVQYDFIVDAGSGLSLPAPARPQYQANFEQYEVAKDSAGRSLQSSMGSSPLPTAAARRSEKSGVALEKIDSMEALGAVQFTDRYENGFLANMGFQLNELITPILDTQREQPVSLPDGKRDIIHVIGKTSHPLDDEGNYDTDSLPRDEKTGEPVAHIHTGKGDFDTTISTGPAEASEREEQGNFVDQLIENGPNLPQPGTPAAKVLALGIRMRPTLGPIGQQIADVFDPPPTDNLPPEARAVVAQLQGQMQQLQQENAALHADRAGRVLEQQTKVHIEQMRSDVAKFEKNLDYITKVVVAQLAKQSKADATVAQMDAQKELTQLGLDHDQIDRAHDAAHEVAMAGLTHQQAQDLAAQQAATQQQQEEAQPQV